MAGLLRSKPSMVWGRGKNKDSVYMKIFILYSVAHFIYVIEMVEVNLKIVQTVIVKK